MIKIVLIFLFSIHSFACELYFKDIKIGEILNTETLSQGYLKGLITNPILITLTLGKKNIIFTNKPELIDKSNQDIYFKKDKKNLMDTLEKMDKTTINPDRIFRKK